MCINRILGSPQRENIFGQSLIQAEGGGGTGKSVGKSAAGAAGKMPGGTIKARMVNSETATNSKKRKGENSAGSPVRHRKRHVILEGFPANEAK